MLNGTLSEGIVRGFVRLVLNAWIYLARILIVVAGLGLAAYLVVRPFWPTGMPDDGGDVAWWRELATWPLLMWNTLLVSGTASVVSVLVGIPLAFLLFRTTLPGRAFFIGGLLLLACLPIFASASAILALVGLRTWEGSAVLAGVIHGWLGIPLAVLFLGLGYRSIDGRLEDAAALDAGWWRVCLLFDLRLILWSVLGVVVFQAWVAVGDIAVTDLLAVRTLGEEVYVTFQLTASA